MLEAIRIFARETNRDFTPSRVTFAHVWNSELKEVHRILRCPVEFMHATDSWVLPESVMEQPIVSNDSHLLQILESHAEDLLSERRKAPELRGLVENHLVGTLPSGRVQVAVVAEQFGMSARSFTRHLAREGTSFSQILGYVPAVSLCVISMIAASHSNRLLGCSVTRNLPHSIMRSGGGLPCHREKRKVCRAYLGRRSPAPLSAIDPATNPAHRAVQNGSRETHWASGV
jgi:hypothetical protein